MNHKDFRLNKWDAYLFDLDGTLIDTRELIIICFTKLLKKIRNIDLSRKDILKYIGLPYRQQLERYTGKLEDKEYYLLSNYHKNYQSQIYSQYIKPCLGAVETVECLYKMEIPLAIVTSRSFDSTADYLKNLNLFKFFKVIVTPESTEKHKPCPEPVLKALELLNIDVSKSVFIGDSLFDIESGNRAFIDTVYTSWGVADFSKTIYKPQYQISNLIELLEPFSL